MSPDYPPIRSQGDSNALGQDSGAFPDVRYIPAGLFRRPTVAVRVEGDPRGCYRCANGGWLTTEEVADAERLVPVGPLLELVAGIDAMADGADERARSLSYQAGHISLEAMGGFWAGAATARDQCAQALRYRLASLLGESPAPPNRQEGGDG